MTEQYAKIILQDAVSDYGQRIEEQLDRLKTRISNGIEVKRTSHEESVYTRHWCESLLWKLDEFYARTRTLLVHLNASSANPEDEDTKRVFDARVPRTSYMYPKLFENTEVVIVT